MVKSGHDDLAKGAPVNTYVMKIQAEFTVSIDGDYNFNPSEAQAEVERRVGAIVGSMCGREIGTLVNRVGVVASGLVPHSGRFQRGGTSYIMMINRANESAVIEHRVVEYAGRPIVLDEQRAMFAVDNLQQMLQGMYGKPILERFNQNGYGFGHYRNDAGVDTYIEYMTPEKYAEENWSAPVEKGW